MASAHCQSATASHQEHNRDAGRWQPTPLGATLSALWRRAAFVASHLPARWDIPFQRGRCCALAHPDQAGFCSFVGDGGFMMRRSRNFATPRELTCGDDPIVLLFNNGISAPSAFCIREHATTRTAFGTTADQSISAKWPKGYGGPCGGE